MGISQQLHSVEPSLPSSEPPTFTIFTVKLVIRTSLGLHTSIINLGLTAWFNGKKAAFNFAVSMVWRELRNHADDCYFCLTNITGFNASSRKKIKYPNLRYAMRPVPHSDDLPAPALPVNKDLLSSQMKKCPQGKILPSQYLWKILSLHIQEQVSMSHTGSRKKIWMILLVICICQNSNQSSWLLGLNSGT